MGTGLGGADSVCFPFANRSRSMAAESLFMKGEEKREEFSETAETGEEICGDGAKAEEVDAIFSRASLQR